ncbi:MAG: single-stranded DNA-binding protein [Gammaproteobacteria bacterium]|nr:single-stranded DNA-binding protein [Gammaproteobacteria bacterium]
MAKGTLQRLTLLGRLGTDPTVKELKGVLVAKLKVATTDRIKKKDAEDWQEETTWHLVTAFGQNAEFCRDYLKTGDTVYMEAKLRNAKWTDSQGAEKFSVDIIANMVQQAGKSPNSNNEPKSDDPLNEIE